jgi:hypothetical protein
LLLDERNAPSRSGDVAVVCTLSRMCTSRQWTGILPEQEVAGKRGTVQTNQLDNPYEHHDAPRSNTTSVPGSKHTATFDSSSRIEWI